MNEVEIPLKISGIGAIKAEFEKSDSKMDGLISLE